MPSIFDSPHTDKSPSEARIFVEFHYIEIKDLLKHFLTLISASLVFSITFAEKIVDLEHATTSQQGMLFTAWFLLVIALGSCGLGLYTLYLSAERAINMELFQSEVDFRGLVRYSYLFQDIAGILFGVALLLLVIAAALKYYT